MMLLNLISPQMRESLKQRVLLSAVRTMVIVILGITVAFTGVLFAGNAQLKAKARSVSQEADRSTLLLRSQGQATVSDTTRLLNSQIKTLQDLQRRHIAWVPVFKTFSELTPAGISLSSIAFNSGTKKITIRGVAATREAYTKYEKVLQSSTLLANVTFPLQTKKTALGFDVTATFSIPL